MYYNEDYPSDIIPLIKIGTNSTFFTNCCGCAICDDEKYCPNCKRKVIGWDAKTIGERSKIRWQNATRNWKR